MTPRGAYYNEIDPVAAAWLKALIERGVIAAGDVDERSIAEVQPDDLLGYTQCHFFAGIGGWSYALRLAGWDDTRAVWTGSCPCQPFSSAGLQHAGADARHLWPEWCRLARECRPPVLFGEQVASPLGRAWFDTVSTDLEGMGYAVGAADLCAASVGALHIRQRLWFVADAKRHEQSRQEPCGGTSRRVGWKQQPISWDTPWLIALAGFRAVADGVPRCVAGTDAARNAIVAQVAAEFIGAYRDVTERAYA